MKASSYATAVLAAALFVACQGKPWGKSATHINNLFGLSASSKLGLEQSQHPLLSARGGATMAEPGDEAEEKTAELYLPGLLDAVVIKSDMVSFVSADAEASLNLSLNPQFPALLFKSQRGQPTLRLFCPPPRPKS